ncbi:putative papain-like cysteine peptidase superfamily [Helianthus anomalus]
MESVLLSADVKNIRDKSLSFVPVLHDDHFYCVCFNLRDNKVEVLDNNAKDVSMKARKLVRPSFYKIQMSFVKKCMISDVLCYKTQLKKLHELVNKLEHNLIY